MNCIHRHQRARGSISSSDVRITMFQCNCLQATLYAVSRLRAHRLSFTCFIGCETVYGCRYLLHLKWDECECKLFRAYFHNSSFLFNKNVVLSLSLARILLPCSIRTACVCVPVSLSSKKTEITGRRLVRLMLATRCLAFAVATVISIHHRIWHRFHTDFPMPGICTYNMFDDHIFRVYHRHATQHTHTLVHFITARNAKCISKKRMKNWKPPLD